MRKLIYSLIILFMVPLFSSCKTAPTKADAVSINEINMQFEHITKTYRIVFLSDLHIISDTKQADEEHHSTISNRKESMITPDGKTSEQYWPCLVQKINQLQPDVVILGGDMIDYMSSSNINTLKSGIDEIDTDVIYIRADHDYANWYNKEMSTNDIHSLSRIIDENQDIILYDLGEICIVGINNNTSQLSSDSLSTLQHFFDNNDKPVIVTCHVPLQSTLNHDLDEESKKVWQDRALIWGNNCYYIPDSNTRQAMDFIYNPDCQVKAILSGHLHFPYTGNLTETTTQYVFDAAYKGNLSLITISPYNHSSY